MTTFPVPTFSSPCHCHHCLASRQPRLIRQRCSAVTRCLACPNSWPWESLRDQVFQKHGGCSLGKDRFLSSVSSCSPLIWSAQVVFEDLISIISSIWFTALHVRGSFSLIPCIKSLRHCCGLQWWRRLNSFEAFKISKISLDVVNSSGGCRQQFLLFWCLLRKELT